MDENFFINAFANVDILKVEAVSTVVGRVLASIHKGLLEAGESEEHAAMVMQIISKSFFSALAELVKT